MIISTTKESLASPLALVAGAADTRGTVPMLGTVLLKATEEGQLSMLCSDTGMLARTLTPVEVKKAGELAVDVRRFFDLVKAVPEKQPIEISLEEKGTLLVKSGRSRFRLPTLAAADYPRMTLDREGRISVTMNARRLADMISDVSSSMADADLRPFLNESGQGVVAFCRATGRSAGGGLVADDSEVDFKTEATASTRRAGDAQLAAHQFDQLAGNRQPHTDAAMTADTGAIGLHHQSVELRNDLRCDADAGVGHRKTQADFAAAGADAFGADADLALLRKFDGVLQQMPEHLPQAVDIAAQRWWQVTAGGFLETQPLGFRGFAVAVDETGQQFIDCERRRVEANLPGFQRRQFDQVGDQVHQLVS